MSAESPPSPSRASQFLRRGVSAGCCAGIVVGAIAQSTFRDHYPFPLATLFYALPRPLLLALAVIGGLVSRTTWSRAAWGILVVVLAGWVSQADVAWNAAGPSDAGGEPVAFWNVGHDLPDDVAVVDEFLAQKPAILGLVETGAPSEEWLAIWQERHPEYDMVASQHGMLLAVRGQIIDCGMRYLAHSSYALWGDALIDGRQVRVVVVDIMANPRASRREPLAELANLLRSRGDGPVVVMGDFNVPDDSVWFEPLRPEFRETFRAAGQGYAPTWPWPAPVLKLDQIWVNRSVDVRRAWQQKTWHSDHRAQWTTVDW